MASNLKNSNSLFLHKFLEPKKANAYIKTK